MFCAGERLAPHAATALANTALGLGYGLILMGFYALRPPVGAVQDLSGHWPTLRCFLPRKQSVLILPKAPLATARVLPALQEDRSRLEGLFGRSRMTVCDWKGYSGAPRMTVCDWRRIIQRILRLD